MRAAIVRAMAERVGSELGAFAADPVRQALWSGIAIGLAFWVMHSLARRCVEVWRWPDDPDDYEPRLFFAKRVKRATDGRPDPWR